MNVSDIAGLERAASPYRLYMIQTHEMYGFHAGQTTDGQQVLAAVDGYNSLILLFNEAGELRNTLQVPLSSSLISHGSQQTSLVNYLFETLSYRDGAIRVKRFHVPYDESQRHNPLQEALIGRSGVSVDPLPDVLQEFLDDPLAFLPEDSKNYIEMISRWITDGNCVLYWGNEYHLSADGVVIAS
jgi:hypothetical protein